MQYCDHCGNFVRWVKRSEWDTRTPFNAFNEVHRCQEYLDALHDPYSTRKKPKRWLYIPLTVAEWRENKHLIR